MTNNAALHHLLTRRSTAVKDLTAPAPDEAQLEIILRTATRVPDHGKLCPWRIVVLREEGQKKLGNLAAEIFAKANPQAEQKHIDHERSRFTRAPLVLAVLFTPQESAKAPDWEQQLSTGAVCMNILHAAHMLGFGGKWLTEWVAYDPQILAALLSPSPCRGEVRRGPTFGSDGPTLPLQGREKIAGFLYLGTKTNETEDRERPNPQDIALEYK